MTLQRHEFRTLRKWGATAIAAAVVLAALLGAPAARAEDSPAAAGNTSPPEKPDPAPLPDPAPDQEPAPSPRLDRLLAFALGFDQPIDGGGRNVPLIVVRAIGDRYLGADAKARFSYDTTSGSALVEAPVTRLLFVGATGTGNWLTARSSTYRYVDGERREDLEVNSTCLGGGAVAGLRFGKIEIRAFVEATKYWFHLAGLENFDMVRPQEHVLGAYGIEASYSDLRQFRNWEITEGFEGSLRAWYFVRDQWRQWGPPGLPQTLPGPDREGAVVLAKLRASFRFQHTSELKLTLTAGAGVDLDVFSGIRAGSLIGEIPVPGYYYSELICDRAAVAGARWAMDLWPGARGVAGVTAGCVRLIRGETLGVAGVSVGITQKTLMGIPVTLEYAFSPTAKRNHGAGGHELYLLVAIGFF